VAAVHSAELLSLVGLGVTVFVSTNLDDIVLLSIFFADRHIRPRAIVAGQFAGIGVLVAVSGLAAFASLAVPEGWTALLGAVPLVLGVAKLRSLWRQQAAGGEEDEARQVPSEHRAHSQVLAVATVTIANGGDNLGVYIPLFAKAPAAVPVYAILFAVMTGIWCVLGYLLVNNPLVGKSIRRYGHALLPLVLIALGLYILAGARPLLGL
jgi:cadmium resistance protein CadD (predicted permease)